MITALGGCGSGALCDQSLRDYGRVEPGQKVLTGGASGTVGTFAVNLAKTFWAQITGACNTMKEDLVPVHRRR